MWYDDTMNSRITSVLLVIMTGVSIFLGVRWYQANQRANAAEKILASQRAMADYASNMQPATFVSATSSTFTYRTPQQVTVGGQTFVNSVEHTVHYSTTFTVFGAVTGSSPSILSSVREGAPIRVLIRGDVIESLYVTP